MGTGSSLRFRRSGPDGPGRWCSSDPVPAARALPRLAAALLLAAGCATPGGGGSWRFFDAPERAADPWYEVVSDWQAREREHAPQTRLGDAGDPRATPPPSALLRVKMGRYRAKERLALARRVADWAQVESRRHYRVDPPTSWEDDPWPTTKDLLDTNGDDCDGLDLITYRLLRDFGFARLYRAIVRRDRDGENHMVTLWFQDAEDPWVIDATAAVTKDVRRFSELPPGWTPTKVFDERSQYTPVRPPSAQLRAAR